MSNRVFLKAFTKSGAHVVKSPDVNLRVTGGGCFCHPQVPPNSGPLCQVPSSKLICESSGGEAFLSELFVWLSRSF